MEVVWHGTAFAVCDSHARCVENIDIRRFSDELEELFKTVTEGGDSESESEEISIISIKNILILAYVYFK